MPVIRSLRNGGSPINGDRRDLAASDALSLTLDTFVGVTSQVWSLLSRPEFSTAGGPAGAEITTATPNGLSLGVLSTAAFTVDADDGPNDIRLNGTYEVQCIINDGAPTRQALRARLSRVAAVTLPGLAGGTLDMRRPGAVEPFDGNETQRTYKNDQARWMDMAARAFAASAAAPVDPNVVVRPAGVAITAGQPLAIETATGNWIVAGADAAQNPDVAAIALENGVVPNNVRGRVCGDAPLLGGGITVGEPVYLGPAGSVTSTPPAAPPRPVGSFRVYLGKALPGGRIAFVQSEPETLA